MRSAVARHHGFSSWFTDFTVDPAIAVWFATGCETNLPAKGTLGVITIADEARLSRLLPRRRYERAASGISLRHWIVEFGSLLKQSLGDVGNLVVSQIGSKAFWDDLRKSKLNRRLEIRHSYAPGPEVSRMWGQKWCSIEASIKDFFVLKHSYADQSLAEQLIARMASRIYFLQDGSAFTQPLGRVTVAHLLPTEDDLADSIEAFKAAKNLNPGAATAALFRRAKTISGR
jgi:hypothetical protein